MTKIFRLTNQNEKELLAIDPNPNKAIRKLLENETPRFTPIQIAYINQLIGEHRFNTKQENQVKSIVEQILTGERKTGLL